MQRITGNLLDSKGKKRAKNIKESSTLDDEITLKKKISLYYFGFNQPIS